MLWLWLTQNFIVRRVSFRHLVHIRGAVKGKQGYRGGL